VSELCNAFGVHRRSFYDGKVQLACVDTTREQLRKQVISIHEQSRGSDGSRTVEARNKPKGVMFHSDQGCHFFRSLKSEWIPKNSYQNIHEAKADVLRYVNHYYTRVRFYLTTTFL